MPFFIVRNDITKMRVDAIVNAAKPSLLGGGGVDGAIHAAAGPELLEECKALGGCEVGQAKITKGYRLPARYVIHTVGPRWHGGLFGEKRKLMSCYRSSLELAAEQGLESVAFPLISSGAYGYPKDKALESAREAIESFLLEQDMTVYLVVYGEESLSASRQVFDDVREYIDRDRMCASTPIQPPQSAREDARPVDPPNRAAWDGEQAFAPAPRRRSPGERAAGSKAAETGQQLPGADGKRRLRAGASGSWTRAFSRCCCARSTSGA